MCVQKFLNDYHILNRNQPSEIILKLLDAKLDLMRLLASLSPVFNSKKIVVLLIKLLKQNFYFYTTNLKYF